MIAAIKSAPLGRVDRKIALLRYVERLPLPDIAAQTHYSRTAVGYRTAAHNAAVGGAKSSQHLLGRAADIRVQGVSVEDVAAYAESLMPDWGGVGRYPVKAGRATGWVHVDTRQNKSRWTL